MVTMAIRHHHLHDPLAAIVGSKYVADEDFVLETYSRDISAFPGSMPGIIVRPGTTEEVSEIVKLANRTGYPIVLKGGGQAGGGVTKGEPTRNIVIDMGRLDKVEVDIANLKATCGAGARNSRIDDALRPYGYYANTVIGPYFTATIGGVTSGIAGAGFGKNVSSVGCNWGHILGLKVVLPTGDIITTGAGPDSNIYRKDIEFREVTGPDLTSLFIGSGGALGIITEVAIKIYPIPKYSKAASYVFDTMENIWAAQLKMAESPTVLYTNLIMFEMANHMVRAMAGDMHGYGALFMAVEGDSEADVDLRLKEIEKICTGFGATRGTPALNHYAATGATGTGAFVHDVCAMSCPFMTWESMSTRSQSLEYAKRMLDILNNQFKEENAKYRTSGGLYTVPIANTMLIGITIHWDDTVPGVEEHNRKLWKAGADFMLKNGTFSAYAQGNHSSSISSAWSPTYYKVMSGIKKTLDPNNILNPGLWNL
jgi:glycolate oxidase